MPRKRNWKLSCSKTALLNPKAKEKKLTDLTGDTGPGVFDPNNSTKNSDCQMELAGDTVPLNNSTKSCHRAEIDCQIDCQTQSCLRAQIDCQKAYQNTHQIAIQSTCQNKFYVENDQHQFSRTSVSVQGNSIYESTFLKFGKFDQSDRRFSNETRGNQCICNCLVFLALTSYKINNKNVDLDYILDTGDQIYMKTIQNLKKQGRFKNMLLTFDEISNVLEICNMKFRIHRKDVLYGAAIQTTSSVASLTLQNALLESFTQTPSALVMIGAICSGVYWDQQNYYFFDSHSHSKSGLYNPVEPSGTSILIAFSNMEDLVGYMYSFYTSMQIDLLTQFEILPLSFEDMDDALVLQRQIQHYFEDQTSKNTTLAFNSSDSLCTSVNRNSKSYMKTYMQERRKNRVLYKQELNAKKLSRQDPNFRKKERQREVESKRKARQCEEMRRKECVEKRLSRQNITFRNKERPREVESKRKARQCKEMRREECVGKRLSRQNITFRNKERPREVESKRKARQCEEMRRKECVGKRLSRQNLMFRNKERQKEFESKRKARQNREYKHKELEMKRKMRENKEFKERELVAKRVNRLNPSNLEKERLRKEAFRHKNHLKDSYYNKVKKNEKRKNTDFLHHERSLKKQRQYGSTLDECFKKFANKTADGPSYICTSCHQTWFFDSVIKAHTIKETHSVYFPNCFTNQKSVDDTEWICHTCHGSIKQHKIPRLSIANKMGFPERPKELELYPLEERLVSLRIPFMQIRQLPRGGQLSIKGNVVNVPIDIQPTINSLPRTLDKSGTISVKLKKKLSYKSCDFSENVRPIAVICALHHLMNESDLYKNSGITIDEKWIEELNEENINENYDLSDNIEKENNEESNDDTFSEIDESESHVGNVDTLLDKIDEADLAYNTEFIFAPGEGQRPISLYSDPDAEYLAFPSIFCGKSRPDNKDRHVPVQYTDIVKWELRSVDRRAAQSVPNLFFKLKKIQLKNISDKVHLALRRCKSDEKKWTAKDVLNPSTVNQLVRLDEGYFIFRTLRNSPVYLEKRKKDLFAMIRQLGLPTWFGSLSSADTKWNDLLRVLARLNDGTEKSDEELQKMNWNEKTKLVQKDPVTCSRFFDHRVQQFIKIVLKSEFHPIGKVNDYFYRVEFQQRGSPHIHILIWVEDAPKYKKNPNEDIVEYIDKHVSCNLTDEFKDLIALQVHKHSKTCRKKGHAICRFGFPLPPMKETVILEPLDYHECVEKHKSMYKEIQEKINSLHELDNLEDMTFEEFLSDILHMTEEDYIKCVRSSLSGAKVFLQRKPYEVRVNPYMKVVLPAWKANHDLQFVLDPYACAIYIVSYISKSQKGMSALLDQAAKEAKEGNLDLKRQVRHIGNYFVNSVETSAQEAAYLTLQMPLTKATRQVVFINTSPSDKRTFLLKKTSELEKISPDSTDIESNNDIKRYSKRPKALENWCLADYISQLQINFPKNIEENDEQCSDNESESSASENEEDTNDGNKRIKITLKNGVTIRQRKTCRVIRYASFNKNTNSENYFRERLMLFYPWRDEGNDLKKDCETFEQMYQTVHRTVDSKAKQYQKNVEELERAIEQAEADNNQYDELAPGTQQVECEDIEEGTTDAEQYIYFNPDRPIDHTNYDLGDDLGVANTTVEITSHAKRMIEDEFHNLIRCLNVKQREFFQHVITWVKTKEEPLFAFLTGGAGVGKSVVVRAVFQGLHRHLCAEEGEDPDDIRVLLCAPTGKAAYNIHGLTIHNAFQIQPNKGLDQSLSCDVLNSLRMKYRNLSVILIDEISMVGNRMFSLIESRLRRIKGNNQTFGGVSLIAIGDFFQLKPVFDGWIFEDITKGIASLAPNLWKDLFCMHELKQIMRQKDDMQFAKLLNRLRENSLTDDDLVLLHTRTVTTDDSAYHANVTHLFIENDLVNQFNQQFVSKLNTEKVVVSSVDAVQADVSAEIKAKLIKSLPNNQSNTANLAMQVELAVGMKYDLTANIEVADGLTNGSSCEIKMFERRTKSPRPSIVWVKFDNKDIGKSTRKKYNHLYSKDVDRSWTPIFDIKRSFTYKYKTFERIQFPLRTAAAKTVHKSQGDTLDQVVVSLKSKCKAKIPHIHYVALSRVRSLSGLQILDFNKEKIAVSESVKEELQRLKSQRLMTLCFIPLYTLSNDCLKIVFNNARSLHAHFDDVKADPNILNGDIVALAETRLVAADQNTKYSLPGFQDCIRNDQKQTNNTTRPPHGLALYLRNDCVCETTSSFSNSDVEFIMADVISCSKGHIQVAIVYKAPQCKLQELKEIMMSQLLPKLDLKHSNIAIVGDFNINLLNGNVDFLYFMERTFGCKQIVSKVTTNYGSMLDLAFIKVCSKSQIQTDVLEAYWSDHNVVYAAIDLSH